MFGNLDYFNPDYLAEGRDVSALAQGRDARRCEPPVAFIERRGGAAERLERTKGVAPQPGALLAASGRRERLEIRCPGALR